MAVTNNQIIALECATRGIMEAMKADIKEYLEDNFDFKYQGYTTRKELEEELRLDLWNQNCISGNRALFIQALSEVLDDLEEELVDYFKMNKENMLVN